MRFDLISPVPAGSITLSKIWRPNFFQTYSEIKEKIVPVQSKLSNFQDGVTFYNT